MGSCICLATLKLIFLMVYFSKSLFRRILSLGTMTCLLLLVIMAGESLEMLNALVE